MADQKVAVFGIYHTKVQAERAVDDLLAGHFSNDDISVSAGGARGGVLGLLAGFGALAIPGVGPFIAAGPILSGLAGLGASTAIQPRESRWRKTC